MAHTFDAKYRFTGTDNPLVGAFTCGAGATVLVLGIVVAGTTARSGGAPTYNGVALTQADTVRTSAATNCELWYLLAPATGGELNVSIPNTGSLTLYACVSSYCAGSGKKTVLDVANGRAISNSYNYASTYIQPWVTGDAIVAVAGMDHLPPPSSRTGTVLYETDDGSYSDNHQYFLASDTTDTLVRFLVAGSYAASCIVAAAFREAPNGSVIRVSPSIRDAYIDRGSTNTNAGTVTTMTVSAYAGNFMQKYALVSLDFSSYVPAGATITSAVLRLYGQYVASGRTIGCFRLRRADWVEAQATWNIYKTNNNWGTGGALNATTDYDATDEADSASLAAAGFQDWTVTAQVQAALDTYSGIAHFLLRDTGASANVSQTYVTREGNAEYLSRRPQLYIEYTVPGGATAKINIGDTFKDVDWAGSKINIGDTWKAIAGVKINIGDTWKDVYTP